MHTGIPRPLAHHPHMMAKGLASLGRGGDDTLVHMSRGEVQRLQQIMQKDGKSLTINPSTGLPEAFSWNGTDYSSVIPLGLGALTGYYMPDSPIMNASLYGGLALATGADLPSAINAGLQFYGGEGLMSGLESSFGFGRGSGAGAGTTGDVGTTGNTDISAGDMAHADLSNIAHPTASAGDMAHADLSNLFGSAQAPTAAPTSIDLPTDTVIPDYTIPDAQFGANHIAQTPQDYTPSLYHRLTDTVGDAYHRVANSPFVKGVESLEHKGTDIWNGLNKAQKTGLTMAGTNILNSLTAPKPTNPAAANPARYYVSSTNQPLYSRRVNPDFLKGVPGATPYIVTTSPGEYTTDASRVQHFKSGGGITALANGGPTTLSDIQGYLQNGAQPQVQQPQAQNQPQVQQPQAQNQPQGPTQPQLETPSWYHLSTPWSSYSPAMRDQISAMSDPNNPINAFTPEELAGFSPGGMGNTVNNGGGATYETLDAPSWGPVSSNDSSGGAWGMANPVAGMGQSDYYGGAQQGGMGGNFLGNVDTGYDQYAKSVQPQASDQSTPADQSPWYKHPFSSLANAWDNTAVGGAIDSAGRYVGDELKKGENYISDSGVGRAFKSIPQWARDLGAGLAVMGGGPLALPILGLNLATRDNGPAYNHSKLAGLVENLATNPAVNQMFWATDPIVSGLKSIYLHNHPSLLPSSSISGPENFDAIGNYIANPTADPLPVGRNMFQQHAAGGAIQGYAEGGGIASLGNTYAAGGKLLRGPGDGMSDSIPAVIGGQKPQQAALADGEFVIPADVVSHLGNGSTEAGSRKLYHMMAKVRHARTGRAKQAPKVNADKFLAR